LAEEDLAEVLAVERASQPLPWWEASFRNELDNPFSTVAVLWQKNELAGYICYHVVLDELTILNLVIAPPFRRPGAARLLLKRTLADASRQNAKKGFLEVRKENHAAIALYQ
jgi:ribosomal-protein-alanine N-acetyltransferase